MLINKKISFLIILLLTEICVLQAHEKSPNKNILILYALSPSMPAYQVITDGIRTNLTETFGDSCNLHTEYLEVERYPKDAYPQERFDIYNEKYNGVDLSLLICIGIDIISTVKSHASSQILNLPAICVDFNFSASIYPIETRLDDKTVVVQFRVDAWKSINTALNLFPGTESLYFLGGVAKFDRIIYAEAIKATEKLDPGMNVRFLNDVSMDEVLKTVSVLPEKSIVIIPSFTIDNKQVTYFNPEAVRLISRVANAPVFTLTAMGFGEGALGGYILSYEKVGLRAGETAVKMLKGADPHSFVFTDDDFYEYVFDARRLKQWNLTGSKLLPEESKIKFEEVSFFGKYKNYITAGIIFILLQTLMIISLIRLYRKQKLVTNQLIKSENRFRELAREDRILRLSQLMASLSHELNQPLTAMLSTAQAGIRFVDSNNLDPALLKELFSNIAEDDKRTASILSSIRNMMKLEKREKERVNISELVTEVIHIYKSELIKKNIRLEFRQADEPVCIIADRIQIQQVIMNLVQNAIQSVTRSDSGNRSVEISLSTQQDSVTVSVKDNGEGIPDSVSGKLFKPFITSKKEGTGIGLAISKSIIEDHMGKIWAENTPGGGATFSFSLQTCQDEPGLG